MRGRKETVVGVEETWAGEEKEFFEDGNGKGDERKEICMDGWMVYIHKKERTGRVVVGGCIPELVRRIICLRSSLSRCLMMMLVRYLMMRLVDKWKEGVGAGRKWKTRNK